ncbi:MAG: cytochrome c [Rhodoferax sp.]|nr:cytochrome c [Rhodoferax sp.]MDP3654238.1 cytochrome c [Rhodoferax sp.]
MNPSRPRKWPRVLVLVALTVAALGGAVLALNLRDEPDMAQAVADPAPTALQIQRGAYLARAGNCQSCHTQAGGAAYAGGRGIDTPFGVVYAGNLTPAPQTGLGTWNATHFWRALHNGRSKDGHLLYPAFPYPQFTRVTRDDSDALFAYLRSLAPVERPATPHALRFPFSTQAALAVWRALFFTPERDPTQPEKSDAWNRGRYLVQGLGHCAACHSPRNALGGTSATALFSGGAMPAQKWYAPSLLSRQEASVAEWADSEVVDLLQAGVSRSGNVSGPMAEVVFGSTQYLSEDDLGAMASYLKDLPPVRARAEAVLPANTQVVQRGAKMYEHHCANCHGDQGQGVTGIYPALAGNRAVTLPTSANLVRVLVGGGFAPVTARNPRPYGMPPFGQALGNRELADVLTFIRQAWGNQASEVSELEVLQAK